MRRADARKYADIGAIAILAMVALAVHIVLGRNLIFDSVCVLTFGLASLYLIFRTMPGIDRFDDVERVLISALTIMILGSIASAISFAVFGAMKWHHAATAFISLTIVLLPEAAYWRLEQEDNIGPTMCSRVFSSLRSEFGSMGRTRKAFAVISVILVVVVTIASVGMLTTVTSEHYTELYVLNQNGNAYDLPHNFTVGSPQNVIIGIANHEGRTVHYFVELWLVNYTMVNGGVQVNHMYAVGTVNVSLNSDKVDLNGAWVAQYEGVMSLNLTVSGNYYLYFMLFEDSTWSNPATPFNTTYDYFQDADATWRVVECVNGDIQYLRLIADVSSE